FWIFVKRNFSPILLPQLGKLVGYRGVHRRMPGNVCRIMRQSSQSEGIVIHVSGVGNERRHKIATADVMHQVAEESIAEGVVTHVLNQTSTIGIRMGYTQFLGG